MLIQKYLNGELDARAMHELERRALDDPFLMEALEGYEANGKDQRQNLADLQKQLQQRIAPKQSRLWPVISIAASVLLFISVGGWWLLNYRAPSNKPNALPADKTEVAKNKPVPAPLLKEVKPVEAPVIKPAAPTQRSVSPQIPDEALANSAAEPIAESKTDKASFLNPVNDSVNNLVALSKASRYEAEKKKEMLSRSGYLNADSAALQNSLAGRVAGVQVNAGQPGAAPMQVRIRGAASISPQADNNLRMITGQVISETDKQPLPGVSIKATTNGLNVLTDARGRFKIPVSDKDELNIIYLGFESKRLKVKGKDSLSITLTGNTSALSEVVVISKGVKREVIEEAHPANGWTAFYKYLDEEARVSNGKVGVVRISFVVKPDKTLSDFKILKSLTPEADKEAIEIIQDGANWIPNVNGKPETVKLRIRFRKED